MAMFSAARTRRSRHVHALSMTLWILVGCKAQPAKVSGPRAAVEKMQPEAPMAAAPVNNPSRISNDDLVVNPIVTTTMHDAGACVTCTPQGGQYCGEIGDNCGGKLACGECAQPGYSCGARGIEHVCGGDPNAGACTVNSCEPENGRYCGKVGDGCGGELDCGDCPVDQACGAAGLPNLCAATPGTCTPLTCSDGAAKYCGEIGDGCGGVLDCGVCDAGLECGARIPRLCGAPCPLCQLQQVCAGGVTTTVSGTAVTAALINPDPLYNAVVYIPNIPLGHELLRLPDGPGCDRCTPLTLDNAVSSAITGPDGTFTLTDVPVGTGIPLIVQLGSWRRQFTIDVQPCVDNPLPLGTVRLPRNQAEGDIPLTAIATGNVDRMQCLMRKIGIEDSEFTVPSGTGRIHMYVSNGSTLGDTTPPITELTGLDMGQPGSLSRYTQVLFPCEGAPLEKPPVSQQNFLDYVNSGGRAFATHYSYTWMYMNGPLAATAQWQPTFPAGGGMEATSLVATIDTSFQKGADFQQWLAITGALTSDMPPQITIQEPRMDVAAVNPMGGAQRWIYAEDPVTVQHFTLDTPVLAPPEEICGRVVFSDFHVLNARTAGSVFPTECDDMPLSAQEKVLEFMLFDLAACIGPNTPPAPPPPPPPPPVAPPPPLPPPPLF